MKYITSEHEHPIGSDYYFEATHTTQDHVPSLPAHTHDYYEIYILLIGSIKLIVEDKLYEINYGDIVLIPPLTIHRLISDDPSQLYQRIYMYITEPCLSSFDFNGLSLLEPIQLAAKNKQYLFHIDEEDFSRIYQAMFFVYRSKKTEYYGKEMLNRSRIIEIITLLNQYILTDSLGDKKSHITPVINKVYTYIDEHYNEPLSLDSLANSFYINKYTLSRMFKKQLMLTVYEYITMKRINSAKLKMQKGTPPSKVYLEVGFNDYSTFYRTFKKTTQMSPQEFAKTII